MSTIYFRNYNFKNIPQHILNELYTLRKQVFHDRLDWQVQIKNGQEIDVYDDKFTSYLLAFHNDSMIAGTRLINTVKPYMLKGTFQQYFNKPCPEDHLLVEASRFFTDKTKINQLGLQKEPITAMLLLYMHQIAQNNNHDAVVAVVSKPMARIIKNNGWQYDIADSGNVKPNETIFWLNMPITTQNHTRLNQFIEQHINNIKYSFDFIYYK